MSEDDLVFSHAHSVTNQEKNKANALLVHGTDEWLRWQQKIIKKGAMLARSS